MDNPTPDPISFHAIPRRIEGIAGNGVEWRAVIWSSELELYWIGIVIFNGIEVAWREAGGGVEWRGVTPGNDPRIGEELYNSALELQFSIGIAILNRNSNSIQFQFRSNPGGMAWRGGFGDSSGVA